MDLEERLRDWLAAEPDVLFGLLFGSRVTGRPRRDSDVDVALCFASGLADRRRFDLRVKLAAGWPGPERIDLVDLHAAPVLLAHQAFKGRLVFVRDRSAYVRLFIRTLAAAGDERPYRRLHQRARLERLREGNYGRA